MSDKAYPIALSQPVPPRQGNELVEAGPAAAPDKSPAFCKGWVFDTEGLLVAHATGTFEYLRGLAVGDRVLQRIGASAHRRIGASAHRRIGASD